MFQQTRQDACARRQQACTDHRQVVRPGNRGRRVLVHDPRDAVQVAAREHASGRCGGQSERRVGAPSHEEGCGGG